MHACVPNATVVYYKQQEGERTPRERREAKMKGIKFDQSITVGGKTFEAGTEFYILRQSRYSGSEVLSLTPFGGRDQLQVVNVDAWAEKFGGEFIDLPGCREYRALTR